jgi:hypothetical protein
MSTVAVGHLYTVNESTINYIRKNEGKIRGSIQASALPGRSLGLKHLLASGGSPTSRMI